VVRRDETLRSIARDRLGGPRPGGEVAGVERDLLGGDPRPVPRQRLPPPADAGSPPPFNPPFPQPAPASRPVHAVRKGRLASVHPASSHASTPAGPTSSQTSPPGITTQAT